MHQAVDALSRLPTTVVYITGMDDEIAVMMVTRSRSNNEKKSILPILMKEEKVSIQNAEDCDAELPTFSELFIAQSKDDFFEHSRHLVETPCIACTIRKNSVRVRKASIDVSVEKFMPRQ